jgi:hypothetical protein
MRCPCDYICLSVKYSLRYGHVQSTPVGRLQEMAPETERQGCESLN